MMSILLRAAGGKNDVCIIHHNCLLLTKFRFQISIFGLEQNSIKKEGPLYCVTDVDTLGGGAYIPKFTYCALSSSVLCEQLLGLRA